VIFFARVRETRLLASLVDVYRGVFLYGDSGSGKSSLVNAGLLPEALQLGFEPVRVRVQPRMGEELVIEQIATSDDDSDVLPCLLAPPHDAGSRIVLSIADFERRVRAASQEHQPLLVFDQFEEIVTLFEGEQAVASRGALAEMIVRLLREPLPVKLLFAFREDYLGRIKQLLGACPELVDQALRLGAPSADALERIIRGPFERFPGRFARELDPALTGRVRSALAARFGTGQVSLSEVQIVCLRLWRSSDPKALLAEKGVQGLLEDELGEALNAFPADLRTAAIAMLSQMVTSAGTRNVISAEDLRQRVAEEDADVAPALVDEALARLERESKLVRRERRRDLYLYEITSEFLVPWISRRREELRVAHERQRDLRRLRIFGSIAGGLLILAAVVAVLAVWALNQRDDARRLASEATSLALAASSGESLDVRPDVSLALAFEAYRQRPRAETRSAVVRALRKTRRSGQRAVLTGHTHLVTAVAFNRDGTILASAGDDAVRLWDPVSRTALGTLRGHRAGVRAVAFSRDGRILASAGNDETVRLWDPATRRQLAVLRHDSTVTGVAFSPDGRTLASAGGDSTVRLWNLATHQQLAVLGRHRGGVTAVAFGPDGKTLVSAGDDATVRLWDLATHKQLTVLGRHSGRVTAVAFSPDGRTVASAGDDATVRLWDPATHKQLGVLGRHRGRVTGVAFSPDGRTVASTGDDATVRLWDPVADKQLTRLRGHHGWVYGLAFSPDGRILASAGDDKTVRAWDPTTHKRFAVLTGHESTVRDLAFSPDGKVLASAGNDGRVGLWSSTMRTRLDLLGGGDDAVYSVAFSPDGQTLASASFYGIVRLWDVAAGKPVRSLSSDYSTVNDVAFSRDGRTLASAHDDGTIRLWKSATGKAIAAIEASAGVVQAVTFGPDDRTLASAGSDGTVRLWDSATHKQLARITIGTDDVAAFALSPDGRTIATATAGDATTVRLWDLVTRRSLARLAGQNGQIGALAFSPSGEVLASAGDNGTALWNPATHRRIARLQGHAGAVTAVGFSPDRKTLVTAGEDGTIRMWDEILWGGLNELHRTVCDVLLGGLSRSEWAVYAPGIAYRRACP
jgi:WD40 repeat protein